MSDSLATIFETHLAMSDEEDMPQQRRSTRGRKRHQPWSPGKVAHVTRPRRSAGPRVPSYALEDPWDPPVHALCIPRRALSASALRFPLAC